MAGRIIVMAAPGRRLVLDHDTVRVAALDDAEPSENHLVIEEPPADSDEPPPDPPPGTIWAYVPPGVIATLIARPGPGHADLHSAYKLSGLGAVRHWPAYAGPLACVTHDGPLRISDLRETVGAMDHGRHLVVTLAGPDGR